MKTTNPDRYIRLGGNLRYLMNVNKGFILNGDNFVIAGLEDLRKALVDLGFEVSTNLFDISLNKWLEKFKEIVKQADDGSVAFPEASVKDFGEEVRAFEDTVYSEVLTKRIAIPVKRLFSLDDLLDNPPNLIGKKNISLLPVVAIADFYEACRCLVFELPTASAFHSLRCVEECVRLLYKSYFRTKLIGKKAWGTLIDELRNKLHRPLPEKKILDQLDQLRDNFRNPTNHPDKFYKIDEAQDLLSLSIAAIKQCAADDRVKALNEDKGPFIKMA